MEIRVFVTKQHFVSHFQWFVKVRSWRRLRIGQLVIEARRIKEEKGISTTWGWEFIPAWLDGLEKNLFTVEEVK